MEQSYEKSWTEKKSEISKYGNERGLMDEQKDVHINTVLW